MSTHLAACPRTGLGRPSPGGISAESRHRIAEELTPLPRRAFQFQLRSGAFTLRQRRRRSIARTGLTFVKLHYHDCWFVFQGMGGFTATFTLSAIRKAVFVARIRRRLQASRLDAFVQVRTPLVTRPLHTRSPRGNTVSRAEGVPGVDAYCPVAVRQLVVARPSNGDAPRRRDQTVGISVLFTHVTNICTKSRNVTRSLFNHSLGLVERTSTNVVAPTMVRDHPRNSFCTTGPENLSLSCIPTLAFFVADLITPPYYNATQARARAPPR